MTESAFRKRGLTIVVDTTEEAELDFALHSLSASEIENIGRELSKKPVLEDDLTFGSVRVREIDDRHEVAFLLTQSDNNIVVLVIGLSTHGELESYSSQFLRASLEQFAPGIAELLKGRRRKS